MSGASKPATPPVRAGQVWEDCDKRNPGRRVLVLRIDGDVAVCGAARSYSGGRETRIRLDRFRPTSTGFRLVEDAAP